MMMHVENICVHVCSHLTIEVFFRKFVKTLRINYKYLNNKQNMCILSKKIVSTSANCSQQHNVVVIAHAIYLQESWIFQRILLGFSSTHAPYQEDPGHEVGFQVAKAPIVLFYCFFSGCMGTGHVPFKVEGTDNKTKLCLYRVYLSFL
jgi:hypothetical protein